MDTGRSEQGTYLKHLMDAINGVLAHLHHTSSYSFMAGKLNSRRRMMSICHQLDELFFFNLVEGLVTSNNPFSE
jgi:coenzyme F420-reducing hydrogenase delta subunit